VRKPRIVTIGVYGSDEAGFFQALADAKVDTFCDVRRRRGLRGSLYAFANSARLQRRLEEMGIRYRHFKELSPSDATRAMQHEDDEEAGIARRERQQLGQRFIDSYTAECLADFDAGQFIEELGPEAKVVALFCVEREPEACHRSLLAERIHQELGLTVQHLRP
jgi:uncharacterized protein (DUF488 family)